MPERTYLTAIDLTDNPPPSLSRLRSWRDQTEVHRAVMALFPDDLPGEPNERRATSRILYRAEAINGTPRLLIQSAEPPEAGATKDITDYHAALTTGTQILVRVQVNTITNKARSNQRVAVPTDQLPTWFEQRLTGITDTQVLDVHLAPLTITRSGREIPLNTAIFDARCNITDQDRFHQILRTGLGRARAYGCGLVSAART